MSQSNSSSYQRDSSQSGLSTTVSQSQTGYSSQTYGSSQHQNSLPSNLQSSPLNPNKLGDSLSKMSVKDSSMDTRQSPQYDSSSTTTSTLTGTTSTSSLSTGTNTPSTTTSTSLPSAAASAQTSKAPPNLPPGVLLGNPQYIVGQGTLPYFPNLQALQQPLYGYEDLQLLQQRLPLPGYNYDLSGFGVPTTLGGRDQQSLGNVPYSGTDNKLTRVDAQSPIPTTQNSSQSTHQQQQQQQQQHFINLPYGYYYPSVLPNAAPGFQFPGTPMFPVPPATNTAHAGTSASAQYQKYGSHYGSKQGYEDLTQATDFSKSSYLNQSQNKVSSVSGGTVTAADLPGTGYGKSHTQMLNLGDRVTKSFPPRHQRTHDAFDKQGFAAGTPPPFSLPLAAGTQAGPMGAPTNPYGTPGPFIPVMPHSQIHHPTLHQDSSPGTSRGSQAQNTSQSKANAAKTYNVGSYWGSS